MLVAVLYTADLRAPKLDEPAVRMLSWNVASLRSSLKKVQVSGNPCRLISLGVLQQCSIHCHCRCIARARPGSCHRHGIKWRQASGRQHSRDACRAIQIMGRTRRQRIKATCLNKPANAAQDSGAISRLVAAEQADVVCLQETKLKDSDVEACEAILRPALPGWHFYWNSSIARKGYSGTAILSRSAWLICVTCMRSSAGTILPHYPRSPEHSHAQKPLVSDQSQLHCRFA